jgi:hypothetical protein
MQCLELCVDAEFQECTVQKGARRGEAAGGLRFVFGGSASPSVMLRAEPFQSKRAEPALYNDEEGLVARLVPCSIHDPPSSPSSNVHRQVTRRLQFVVGLIYTVRCASCACPSSSYLPCLPRARARDVRHRQSFA